MEADTQTGLKTMVRRISRNNSHVANNGGDAPASEPALVCREPLLKQAYHYWRGASGRRYLHTVYPLLDCPAMPSANYILVRTDAGGARRPLAVGQTDSEAETLNLAHLRQRAAQLGADEVHVHFLAGTFEERDAVEADIAMRQVGRGWHPRAFNPANDAANADCA